MSEQQSPFAWDALPEATRTALREETARLQANEHMGASDQSIGQRLKRIQALVAPYGLFNEYCARYLKWSYRKVYELIQLADVDVSTLGIKDDVLARLAQHSILELTAPTLSADNQQALIDGLNNGRIAPQMKAIKEARRQLEAARIAEHTASFGSKVHG
jgi:hypothetical protein